ncbi:histidine phosphatase superfamily [Xylaria palmicola]|nr:histidine phosphatase superfamily [Xylaria palmicola]
MAPDSRIIITRHAQAEHNVFFDYSIHDAPLTALGKRQAAALAVHVWDLQAKADVVVSSPMKRALQTTRIGWAPAIDRLGGPERVVCLPALQETNGYPCDTGSSREALEGDPEFAAFNLELLTPDWTCKEGFWSPAAAALEKRARWVRQYLRDRPEKNIVVVAHGGIIRRIIGSPDGPSMHPWWNTEVRIFEFVPASVDTDDCWLYQKENVAVTGGYGPTGEEIDIAQKDLNC